VLFVINGNANVNLNDDRSCEFVKIDIPNMNTTKDYQKNIQRASALVSSMTRSCYTQRREAN